MLRVAVERDDEAPARLALAAGPDLTIRDLTYDSDPLRCAEFLGRPRLAAMIREACEG